MEMSAVCGIACAFVCLHDVEYSQCRMPNDQLLHVFCTPKSVL